MSIYEPSTSVTKPRQRQMVGLNALGGMRWQAEYCVDRRDRLGLARLLSGSCGRLTRLLTVPVAMTLVTGALLAGIPQTLTSAQAATCTANPIVCENQKTGTPPSTWDVSSDDTYMQGFADPFSVNVGGTINFKIQTAASSYSIDIYRMGYYGGDGARLIQSIPATPRNQPACNTNTVTGLVDCGNWSVSATWNVPADAVSGVYFAHIYTAGATHENQIPFVVTNNASTANMVFTTSDETWQAYNNWGGYSLYQGNATGSPWCCRRTRSGPRHPGQLQPSFRDTLRTRGR